MPNTRPIAPTESFVIRSVSKAVLIYAVVAALWILLSDQALILFTADPKEMALFSTIKGWLFVFVTSALLAQLVNHYLQQLASVNANLRSGQERLRSILEEAVDAFFQGDQSGKLVEVNAQSCALTGYARDELLAMNMKDLFAPEELSKAALRHDLLQEGQVVTAERMLTRKDASTVAVEMKSTRMSDGNCQSIFRDLTQRHKAEASVRRSEARLRQAELVSGTGNWELRLDSGAVTGSEGAARIYGVDPVERELQNTKTIALPEYRALLDAALHDLVVNGYPYDVEYRIRAADTGEIKAIHSIATFNPETRVVFGILQDITARNHTENRLHLAASVFSHAREAIAITDASGSIVDVNDTFTSITGYSREEALGQNPRILKSGRQTPDFYAAMWRSLAEEGHWSGEIWNQRKCGQAYAQMLTISAVRDSAGNIQNYVALFSDITMIKEHQKQLEHIAHYDALTGLPNRVLFGERLQQAIIQSKRYGRSLAIVYLDLDGFKAVNDLHGHDVGDELLIHISRRMKQAMREGDTLARLGGDEFVAVLVNLEQPDDCTPMLAHLLGVTTEPASVGGTLLQISASIGVTLYPQDQADAEQLLRHADQAMCSAKQAGKNRYHVFDIAQDQAVNTQRESLQDIYRAFVGREFVLHYQPKVNLRTGKVIGAEALIRWQHPQRGLLEPVDFMPIIENQPFAVELGEWVIGTALAQMSAWKKVGLDIPVSVNVGALQLQQHGFAERLSGLLRSHPGIRPSSLQLEVLETSALEDLAKVSQIMHACCALGVRFALDDFGTGYSSLAYLKSLPVDLLKIDQSFVRDMLGDKNDLAIVEAVVGLAEAFRRGVIAEGVETVAHGKLLLHLGCELAQGHGIARAMPAAMLPGWVVNWRPAPEWTA